VVFKFVHGNAVIMEILLATRNPHKIRELTALFSPLDLIIKTLRDFPDSDEPAEDGKTFEENAVKKALHSAQRSGIVTLADDSGLEVAALGGRPGIFSSRYATTNPERIARLLDEMKTVPRGERSARFVCAMALASPAGRAIVRIGYCEGEIAFEPRGTGGFGYDPIFYLPADRATMAELPFDQKNRISHRARAAQQLIPLLQKLIDKQATFERLL
jgi:XTP/dITP diphosphohydrolase